MPGGPEKGLPILWKENYVKKVKTRIILIILIVLMAGITLYSGIRLILCLQEKERVEEAFDRLSLMTDTDVKDGETKEEKEASDKARLEKYRKLHELNSDFVGWIRIEGTNINYPVMQSVEDPEFYLDHDFDKEYCVYGVPFADAACEIGISNNIILYGHRMSTDSMFHEILYYEDPDYREEYPLIRFDTLEQCGTYEVIAAFRYDVNHDPFRFNLYTDMDMETFAEYIRCVQERQLYSTGLSALYGDRLLTLSTCDYYYGNGRFVVVAREVK